VWIVELVATDIGLLSLAVLIVLYVMFARVLPLGALSMPCMTLLTSMMYFFIMPGMALSGGYFEFLGMYLNSLEGVHAAVLLYALGGAAAWVVRFRSLRLDPAAVRVHERPMNLTVAWVLAAVAMAGVLVLVALGRLQFFGADETQRNNVGEDEGFAFLALSVSMLIPLVLILLLRTRFHIYGLLVLAGVFLVILTTGFRFRIVILASAVVISYMLVRHIRIRVSYVALGSCLALIIVNAIGFSRTYGRGIDLSRLEGFTWVSLLHAVGGEIGPVFALAHIVESPPPDLIYFEPWTVGIARLVPSFLWPDKPYPNYLLDYGSGFGEIYQRTAGVAAPQQAEFLLQFGWFGLPLLAFLYFAFACKVVERLQRLGLEARIAGCAMAPAFFGFYMQQRGYFFQLLCEFLFMFGPLFLVYFRTKPPSAGARELSAAISDHPPGLPGRVLTPQYTAVPATDCEVGPR
jgi:hypothetical protein